jgi:hypothetical protein
MDMEIVSRKGSIICMDRKTVAGATALHMLYLESPFSNGGL